ncbi:dynamin family protein [Frankia sp. CcI49]|uniref:dynamin family protein n=1 Tax=Frankia sp. CcI49 TaxID=1745382 RepID=UPI000E2EE3B8|nr:dynamin family protein [Frankia sp. CcI49]
MTGHTGHTGHTGPGDPAGRPGSLRALVRALLLDTLDACQGCPAEPVLREEVDRFDGPLRVALAGRVKAGKSTLLNALAGEQIAATDATECTRIVTSYAAGTREAAWAYLRDGSVVEARLSRTAGSAHVDLAGLPGGAGSAGTAAPGAGAAGPGVEALRVELPGPRLHGLTLIDTPGIASLSVELSRRTESFLTRGARRPAARRPGGRPAGDVPPGLGTAGSGAAGPTLAGADAIVYLLRHLHAADVDFLASFRRTGLGEATPAHAIGVLSRADEIAPGRTDSVDVARRAAAAIGRDERVRALVQTVVPVAGLLAQAGTRLSGDELGQLLALAAEPAADTDDLLLSVDRFVAPAASTSVAAPVRALLIDGLGLAGVRLAVALARLGYARDPAELAAELTARSGLPELTELLRGQFTDRADVLKAQHALRVLDGVLGEGGTGEATGADGPVGPPPRLLALLRARREQIEAGAHELAELRLIGELRTGTADLRGLDGGRRDEMERLLGAAGVDVRTRLGLPADADAAEIRPAVLAVLGSYRQLAENRLLPQPTRRAAAILRRTCEGLLHATTGG